MTEQRLWGMKHISNLRCECSRKGTHVTNASVPVKQGNQNEMTLHNNLGKHSYRPAIYNRARWLHSRETHVKNNILQCDWNLYLTAVNKTDYDALIQNWQKLESKYKKPLPKQSLISLAINFSRYNPSWHHPRQTPPSNQLPQPEKSWHLRDSGPA